MSNTKKLFWRSAVATAIAGAIGFASASNATETNSDLWALMEPACNANGIDPDPCRCIMNAVIAAHGTEATRYVALEMLLQYEEAEALKQTLGETQAMNASETFDVAQNTTCTNVPATAPGPASVESSATGADTAQ